MTNKLEITESPLAKFLATHPHEKKAHELRMEEFRKVCGNLISTIKPVLQGIIDKAEQVRRVGIVLTEEAQALPGGKFSRDFYEQMKHELTDERGQTVSFELCEWAIKVAKENLNPIEDLNTALKWRQPLLLATGEEEFALQMQRAPQVAHAPPDPRDALNKVLDAALFKSRREEFTKRYYQGGTWMPGVIDVVAGQWKPFFDEVELFRQELGI